jgi:hypothetical protein
MVLELREGGSPEHRLPKMGKRLNFFVTDLR